MKELVLNKTSHVEIKSDSNKTLTHSFGGIRRGGRYEICVATNSPNAVPANITALAQPLPAPSQLKVYPEKNGSYVVFWKEITDFKEDK